MLTQNQINHLYAFPPFPIPPNPSSPSPYPLLRLLLAPSLRAMWRFFPLVGPRPGPVLSHWMAPSTLCPAVIEHYEVFHASVH